MIMAADNYLRITVVTPIRTWVTNKKSSESERYNSRELESVSSSSKVINVFPPSGSRRSLSSSMSSISDLAFHLEVISLEHSEKNGLGLC